MPEESKPERADEETSASETRKEVVHSDDPRESIYEKYDAIKKAREEAEAAPAEEESGETPPKEASVPEEKTEAEQEEEVASLEQAKEKVKGLKIKVKLDGKEEVLTAEALLERSAREEGRDRALSRKEQALAREREAFEHQRAVASQPSPVSYEPPTPDDGKPKPIRHWSENEVASKYDELFSESPYKAQQFLNTVQGERQKAQEEGRKARMDTAERDFFALHPEAEAPIKEFFSDPKAFSDPRISAAFERADYYGALEIANVRIESQEIAKERAAIKAARDAAAAEEKKKIDLKKKGSVIRTSSKPEVKPQEEFKPPTPSESIAAEAARRRALRNQ